MLVAWWTWGGKSNVFIATPLIKRVAIYGTEILAWFLSCFLSTK